MTPEGHDLSEREQEILALVATGASNKEVAAELFISPNTVKVHLSNIYSKLDVSSRTEAALYAINAGLATPVAPGVETDIETGDIEQPQQNLADVGATPKARASWRTWFIVWMVVLVLGLTGVLIYLRLSPIAQEQNGSVPLQAVEISAWQNLAIMPTARSGLAVVDYGSNIYAIGGKTDAGVTGIVEQYDATRDFWYVVSNKPVPVTDIQAETIGGKIYIPGGMTGSGTVTEILEIYDPGQNEWSRGAAMPFGISAYALTTFEGRLFLFGGWDGVHYLDVVLEYNPQQDRWTEQTSMPTGRAYAGAATSGSRIIVVGGYNGKTALAVNEIYYPTLDIESSHEHPWLIAASLPSGRYAAGIASVAGIVYVVGGQAEGEQPLTFMEYTPELDAWGKVESSNGPDDESYLGFLPISTRLYAIGGQQGDDHLAVLRFYQIYYTISVPLVPVDQ
ncbi:LuxR C-terminal-related transcriptional regulator [Chloroflexota bacterium]